MDERSVSPRRIARGHADVIVREGAVYPDFAALPEGSHALLGHPRIKLTQRRARRVDPRWELVARYLETT